MTDSLPRCVQCSSPVTDSIQIEIESHERVKFGKRIDDSWIYNDCATKRSDETTSTVQAISLGNVFDLLLTSLILQDCLVWSGCKLTICSFRHKVQERVFHIQ